MTAQEAKPCIDHRDLLTVLEEKKEGEANQCFQMQMFLHEVWAKEVGKRRMHKLEKQIHNNLKREPFAIHNSSPEVGQWKFKMQL